MVEPMKRSTSFLLTVVAQNGLFFNLHPASAQDSMSEQF